MVRGMIATVHVQLSKSISNEAVRALYEEHYAGEAMIALRDTPPATGDARGTNRAHIHVAVDAERQVLTSICVIDNLVKGASGQAVQALNVALNIPEATGLPMFPVLP
jgi:N-acetyl-gamma-glutamyl-phosphate reductase